MGDAIDDAYELDDDMGPVDSQEPLTSQGFVEEEKESAKDRQKDIRSFCLSIFNLMNAILGSGILGLAEAMMNLGVALFYILMAMTACLAGCTLNLLLQSCDIAKVKSYEGLAMKSFGIVGKVVVCIMIIIHCLGAMCSYVFIIKAEMPEVMKVFMNYASNHEETSENLPIYFKGEFLMIMVVIFVIMPLASMRDIRFLGYSSAFGMACMLLFTFTVIAKRFSIPCPLPKPPNSTLINYTTPSIINKTINQHSATTHEPQICEAEVARMTSRSAYAVPTMFFAFMCHASMLPIYQELRRPSAAKMQKVANISIFLVLLLYILSASFGYFTFYNLVQSELLLTYSLYEPNDPAIILSRVMVLVCVTLSVPLLHFPCRKTIITTFFPNSKQFSWIRHLLVMAICLTLTVTMVTFVPNIRDIFGIAGATSSGSLLILFPCAFYIKLTKDKDGVELKRKLVMALFVVGTIFMITSVILIVNDWFGH